MSTQQVQRLQALLERVQHNRDAPRAAAATFAAAAAPDPAPAAAPGPAPSPVTPTGLASPATAHLRTPPAHEELDFSSLPPQGSAAANPDAVAFTPAERRTRPGATPLELAVEDTLDRPAVSPVVARPAPPPPPPSPVPAATAAGRSSAAGSPGPAPSRHEGVTVAEPVPAASAKPIAQVLSRQPPVAPTSFGDLLKRSLALRPR